MARSLNKATLIGNMTRDPELRYTPSGAAVCSFGLATNRSWNTETGEKKEETEFHRIVAWNKLAELCAQLLTKGRKVYVEGRLQTRKWTGNDNLERTTTEIVISDMIILDSRGVPAPSAGEEGSGSINLPDDFPAEIPTSNVSGTSSDDSKSDDKKSVKSKNLDKKSDSGKKEESEDVADDDIPF
ncbi:MAG TPA: single-stranded DNA-binding protein [Patescibacteria group bacterium]|nr:single-stranded DNA-binding protein [Patescibacteria group bacterium]